MGEQVTVEFKYRISEIVVHRIGGGRMIILGQVADKTERGCHLWYKARTLDGGLRADSIIHVNEFEIIRRGVDPVISERVVHSFEDESE